MHRPPNTPRWVDKFSRNKLCENSISMTKLFGYLTTVDENDYRLKVNDELSDLNGSEEDLIRDFNSNISSNFEKTEKYLEYWKQFLQFGIFNDFQFNDGNGREIGSNKFPGKSERIFACGIDRFEDSTGNDVKGFEY